MFRTNLQHPWINNRMWDLTFSEQCWDLSERWHCAAGCVAPAIWRNMVLSSAKVKKYKKTAWSLKTKMLNPF